MPCVRSGIRSLWSIPRFQHIASVVREHRGNWRGCSNQSSGDNNAVVPAKLQSLKVFDVIGNFQPIIHLRKGFGNDIVLKLPMPTAKDSDYEAMSTVDPLGTMDIAEVINTLSVIPKRLKDLEEQLKCSKEEVIVLRKRLSKLEEENKNLNCDVILSVNKILRMRLMKETED